MNDKVLPEKWFVVRNKENHQVLNKWNNDTHEGGIAFRDDAAFVFSDQGCNRGLNYKHVSDYTEITFDDFEKYVLNKQESPGSSVVYPIY